MSRKRPDMYFDVQRTRVYKDSYRPSSNMYRFFKCLMLVIVEGRSPSAGHLHYYPVKKRR